MLVGGHIIDVIAVIGPWVAVPVFLGHTASTYTPEYRVNSGRVEMRGAVIKGEGNTNISDALPTILRPKNDFAITIAYATTLASPWYSGNIVHAAVTTFGSISQGRTGAAASIPVGSFIYLDGISWAIET